MRYCENCGTRLDPEARFCPVCGHPVMTDAEPAKMIDERTVSDQPRHTHHLNAHWKFMWATLIICIAADAAGFFPVLRTFIYIGSCIANLGAGDPSIRPDAWTITCLIIIFAMLIVSGGMKHAFNMVLKTLIFFWFLVPVFPADIFLELVGAGVVILYTSFVPFIFIIHEMVEEHRLASMINA